MLEKMPGEPGGKVILEKVPDKLLRKLYVGKSAWRAALKRAEKNDCQNAVSSTQCCKPQDEKTTVQASVGRGNESCFTYFITHFSEIITC